MVANLPNLNLESISRQLSLNDKKNKTASSCRTVHSWVREITQLKNSDSANTVLNVEVNKPTITLELL